MYIYILSYSLLRSLDALLVAGIWLRCSPCTHLSFVFVQVIRLVLADQVVAHVHEEKDSEAMTKHTLKNRWSGYIHVYPITGFSGRRSSDTPTQCHEHLCGSENDLQTVGPLMAFGTLARA